MFLLLQADDTILLSFNINKRLSFYSPFIDCIVKSTFIGCSCFHVIMIVIRIVLILIIYLGIFQ